MIDYKKLLEENFDNYYSRILLKTWIIEGVTNDSTI